jgi:iron complex outermembrane receptor protein
MLIALQANAQAIDSVHQLKSITISADRLNLYTQGLKISTIDSATLENYHSDNAAVLLAAQTPVYVKTYGQGGLATLSIRGTLATHAGVYWNGVNINQPNIGMTDISLVPLFFFESVALQYGGSSSLFGSGNIGGGLHLDNHPHFSSPFRIKISSGTGSFDEYLSNIKATKGWKNFAWSTGASFKSLENDYPYASLYNHHVHQQNAALRNYNILQQIDFKTSRNSTLSAGLWMLISDRDLPSSMIASPGKEHQQDQSTRAFIKWELMHQKNILIIRSAWLLEKMHYRNPQILTDAHYLTKTGLIEGEFRWQAKPKTLFGISGSISKNEAIIYAYSGNKRQVNGSVVGSVQQVLPLKGWVSTLSLRKEWIQGYSVPFSPSLGVEGFLIKNLTAKLHLSRNFRAPTLNDRYWQPGGNENLKPETSWAGEAGIYWQTHNTTNTWQAAFGLTAYSTMIRDLILWTPGKTSIWSPENVQEVFSRGLEFTSSYSIKRGKSEGKIHATYSYTPSTFNKNESGSVAVKGNQLTYVPLHNAVAGLRINLGTFFIDWEQSLTGKRFVLKDNSMFLDSYTMGNFIAGKLFMLEKIKFSLQAEIHNLFNTDYQSIQNFAVPGRSFRIILNLTL